VIAWRHSFRGSYASGIDRLRRLDDAVARIALSDRLFFHRSKLWCRNDSNRGAGLAAPSEEMRMRLLFALALMVALTAQASAQTIVGMTSLGYQQFTSLAAAQALTVPSGTAEVLVVCETQNVRWRDDGTDPTASVGMLLQPGQSLPYTGSLARFKLIQTTASATCNVTYLGY
jgi:hypothetical protein